MTTRTISMSRASLTINGVDGGVGEGLKIKLSQDLAEWREMGDDFPRGQVELKKDVDVTIDKWFVDVTVLGYLLSANAGYSTEVTIVIVGKTKDVNGADKTITITVVGKISDHDLDMSLDKPVAEGVSIKGTSYTAVIA